MWQFKLIHATKRGPCWLDMRKHACENFYLMYERSDKRWRSIALTSYERHGVSNHWQRGYLFISLFRSTTKKPKALYYWALCERNTLGTSGFPSQKTSNVEIVSMSWLRHSLAISHHDDVIKCKHSLRYRPFVREIHRSPGNSPHKGQWRGVLMFSLICAWINGWVNNGEAGDLRRHRAHYDVTIMHILYFHFTKCLWAQNQISCFLL